jgi:hypothetical protein
MKAIKTGTALLAEGRPLSHREKQLRKEVVAWVTSAFASKGRLLFAVTLTCKQAIPGPAGLVWLSKERLSEALQVYFKRIDWEVFKNACRRGEKCVERFCVIEGGSTTGKRMHVHALLLAPPARHMHLTQFITLLRSNWVSSPWGMKDVRFDLPASPMAAAYYLTKTGLDAVDLSNTQL